jgi:hypothetical protein
VRKKSKRTRIPVGEIESWHPELTKHSRTVARSTRARKAIGKIKSYLAKGTNFVDIDRQLVVDMLSMASSAVGIWCGIRGK